MPHFNLLDTEGRGVYGKTILEPGVQGSLPQELGAGLSLIGKDQNSHIKLFTDVMRFSRGSGQEPSGISLPPDYIYWVLCFRKDIMGRWEKNITALSNKESAQLSLDLTSGWHPSLRALLENQQPESTSTLAFHTSWADNFSKQWKEFESKDNIIVANGQQRIPVTLLGDAAHAAPPVGGVGANSAFEDAAELLEAITREKTGHQANAYADGLRYYESLMVERARPAIERSVGGAGRFFGMRPIEELIVAQSERITAPE